MNPNQTSNPIWRRNVLAWCCYDWANSGYTTLMITVFAVYMQRTVFSAETSGSMGAVVWAWSVAISMLIGALLSPLVGALADARAGKRLGLGITAMGGGAACMLMALIPPENIWLVTSCFILANLCLELSLTLYNGFLPEVADEAEMNRVSAAGMAWGYFGGGLGLLLAMLSSTFAIQELKFTDRELIAVILMVQFIATPGAIFIGWISDRVGRKQALVMCLLAWVILLASASLVQAKAGYWVLSGGVALVLGGTQAVSRAIMGSLTPKHQEARYFGFFNLSGKATSFLGTFFFGLVIAATGSSRAAIVGLLVFFVIGLLIIAQLDLGNKRVPQVPQ